MSHLISFELLSGLALSVTFGGMTFFSGVMAPLVFTKLPLDTAGAFIRQVFPWYYLTMGGTTLLAFIALLPDARDGNRWPLALTGVVLLGFLVARQALMPRINRAREEELAGDEDAGDRFRRLHGLSVAINATQWLAVLAALWLVLL